MRTILRRVRRVPWEKLGVGILVAAPVLMIAIQFLYPFDRTMLATEVSGVDIGGLSRDEAMSRIEGVYKAKPLDVYFGETDFSVSLARAADAGRKGR